MCIIKFFKKFTLTTLNWLLLFPITMLAIFCIYGIKWATTYLLLLFGRGEVVPQIILAASIVVIALQVWWILSEKFTQMSNRLFWGCLLALFLGVNIFQLWYFPMIPTIGDDVIFLRFAKSLTINDTWENICRYHSYGNAYHLRSLWCWYLPFKIFGTSAYVYKIFNCLFQFGTAVGLYWICKECFHNNRRISRGTVVLWLLSPIMYLLNQGGGSEIPGIFWGVLFSGFGLAIIRRIQRFPFWRGKPFVSWDWKEYTKLILMISGALLCFIFVNNARQIGLFYIVAIFGLIVIIGVSFLITRFNRRKIAFPIALLILWGGIFAAGLWIPNQIFSLDLSKHPEFSNYRADSSAWVWIVNMPSMGSRDQNIMRTLSEKISQHELRRQLVHHVFLIPLFERESTTTQIDERLAGLNNFYKEMKVLFQTDDKQKNQLFQELCASPLGWTTFMKRLV